MMTDARFRLGSTVVEIAGDHTVARLVRRELELCADNAAAPHIRFILTEKPLPQIPAGVNVVGPVFALPDKAWIHWDPIGYRALVSWDQRERPGFDVQVQIMPFPGRPFIPTFVHRWRNLTYISPWEQRAYSFVNGVLESLLLFLGESTALLHTSVVERGGQAVCFPSTGGTGKTTLSLLLTMRHGFRWLADDIALITEDGRASLYPRHVMMYAYSLLGLSTLERAFLRRRSILDRVHWMLRQYTHGPKRVRRRVPPDVLFGDRIAESAAIERVLFLVRCPGSDFQREEVSPRRLAGMCTHIILSEYSHYINYLRYWEATGLAPVTVEMLQSRVADLYERAFARATECALIRIPLSATPAMLEEFIVRVVEDV